ncbi:MAG TPA: molybdopterin molybdotransferase MoeA [Hadesarchaea archaeon]|nr:molybdopterin molybdotransferase MoeA [Hadesarchaea archaeon]
MRVNKMSVRMRGFFERIRLSDALKIILSQVKQLGAELVPFPRSLDRVLAENVVSRVDIPPFDRSAVDGYAVRSYDTFGASQTSPKELCVVCAGKTGTESGLRVHKKQAVKLMTGAPMPEGADAVLMVEHAKTKKDNIAVLTSLTPGKNVSIQGEDVRKGEVVLKRCHRIRPQDVGMLASIGHLKVRVFRRPSVAIMATGSELRPPGTRLKPAQITDINSYSLAAGVASCGGVADRLGIVPDDPIAMRQALQKTLRYDVVLISGGSAVGEHDMAPDMVSELGKLIFHGVAMRPGGPTAFGVIKEKPIFCLAGFPVASLVAFDMLVRPALRAMQGLPADWSSLKVKAKLTRKIASSLGCAEVVRVRVWDDSGELLAEPIRVTGSGILSSMTRADGFVVVPENVEGFDKDQDVEVKLYG